MNQVNIFHKKAVLIYTLPVWKVLKLKCVSAPKKQPTDEVVAGILICNWRRTETGMIIDILRHTANRTNPETDNQVF